MKLFNHLTMKLSLTIPTFNEEQFIHYPLESAIDLVDEVVVIDGGSKDRTVAIAKSYGEKVRVFVVDNPKNFLINKQRAIEKARGEWILQLDADEALSDELKKEIKAIVTGPAAKGLIDESSHSGQVFGYWVPRKNFFLTRFLMKGGVYPDYVLRLYKKKGAKFLLKDLHENVTVEGETGYLKNAILHYADPDFSRYLKRWDRYTTFDAQELTKKKKSLGFFTFLNYFFVKPTVWFLKTYFRHKGFMDGFAGFVFSLFSSIRFWVIYIKAWQIKHRS